ncbi:MAG: SDR family NAD(P)-dependent oxidoreductase [Congregibacter sp.]
MTEQARRDEYSSIVITGANRGMGLEFARQYANDGWRVFATARSPGSAKALQALSLKHALLTVHALDVSSSTSVSEFADELRGQAIDVLLSNASHMINLPEQCFERGDPDLFAQSFEVNAVGPFRLAQGLIDNVRAGEQKKLVFMGSTAGSTSSIVAPVKLFAYCPAKAALHSIVRGLHLNLSTDGISVGLLEPGVVDTQGFADLQPGEPAPYGMDVVVDMLRAGTLQMSTPAEAVVKLRTLIDTLTPDTGGVLRHVEGHIIPW